MEDAITKLRSLGVGNSGLPITFTRIQRDLMLGSTVWLTRESTPLPMSSSQSSPEVMLSALLTHSRYLRPAWLQLDNGLDAWLWYRTREIPLSLRTHSLFIQNRWVNPKRT